MQNYCRLYSAPWQKLLYHVTHRIPAAHLTQKSLNSANVSSYATFAQSRQFLNQRNSANDWSARSYSGSSSSELCCPVSSRTLVRVGGKDSREFLQGLITNDMNLLSEGDPNVYDKTSMYAMMLNIQGRVLYDIIVYLLPDEEDLPVFLLECDKQIAPEFVNTMKRYKIRKKVTMKDVGDEYKLLAVLPPDGTTENSSLSLNLEKDDNVIRCVPDPRLSQFGHRLILRDNTEVSKLLPNSTVMADEELYTQRRYMAGLSEGILDLPPANCTPLESNAVFLNGVSFSKGCYIGQELTARTHHTGVIRKRLMPVNITGSTSELEPGATVENSSGKNCGKFRNSCGAHGLALLRLPDVIGKGILAVKNSDKEKVADLDTFIPSWWPTETDEIIRQVLENLEKS